MVSIFPSAAPGAADRFPPLAQFFVAFGGPNISSVLSQVKIKRQSHRVERPFRAVELSSPWVAIAITFGNIKPKFNRFDE
jgi:hypothetical protein